MATTWTASSGGIDWTLSLDRDALIPGRLVAGRLRLAARKDVEGRGVIVTLRGEERWKYETSDGKDTRVVEERADLPATPVRVSGPVALAAGEALDLAFELPAPPLGPPSFGTDKAGCAWTVEAKLDREGFDSAIVVDVRVVQPTALLRAGVVHTGPFALYEDAGADDRSDLAGTIELDPMPLVAGSSFTARIRLQAPSPVEVRGIRGELKVRVEVTDPTGMRDDIVAWSGVVSGPATVQGVLDLAFDGRLDAAIPPTTELAHSRVHARFEVILDRPMRPDVRLVRDVAVAGTDEV